MGRPTSKLVNGKLVIDYQAFWKWWLDTYNTLSPSEVLALLRTEEEIKNLPATTKEGT
jgi:hypothetical protein